MRRSPTVGHTVSNRLFGEAFGEFNSAAGEARVDAASNSVCRRRRLDDRGSGDREDGNRAISTRHLSASPGRSSCRCSWHHPPRSARYIKQRGVATPAGAALQNGGRLSSAYVLGRGPAPPALDVERVSACRGRRRSSAEPPHARSVAVDPTLGRSSWLASRIASFVGSPP